MNPKTRNGGPKTKAGKKISSQNAIKHGLTSRNLLSSDEQGEFYFLVKQLKKEYDPKTITENTYIERIAKAMIQVKRIDSAQEGFYELAQKEQPLKVASQIKINWDDETKKQYKRSLLAGEYKSWSDEMVPVHRARMMMAGEVGKLLQLDSSESSEVLEEKAPTLLDILLILSIKKNVNWLTLLQPPNIDDEKFIDEITVIPELSDEEIKITEKKKFDQEGSIDFRLIQPFLRRLYNRLIAMGNALEIHHEIQETGEIYSKVAMPDSGTMDKLLRYSTAANKQLSKLIGELRHIIKERKQSEQAIS